MKKPPAIAEGFSDKEKIVLLQEHHLADGSGCSCLEFIEVNTGGEIRSVELDGV